MYNLYILIIIIIFINFININKVYSEVCTNSYTNEIPDSNCTIIDGSISINAGFTDSLDGFSNITEITGDLTISNSIFDTIDNFKNLQTVGNDIEIKNNEYLNYTLFTNLQSARHIIVTTNPILTYFGAPNLTSLTNLEVESQPQLDMQNLETINEFSYTYSSDIDEYVPTNKNETIINLNSLTTINSHFTLNALYNCKINLDLLNEIGGDLFMEFVFCNKIQFPSLKNVLQDLLIRGSTFNMSGSFEKLETVGDRLEIKGGYTKTITSKYIFNILYKNIFQLIIYKNNKIGFDSLKTIGSNLYIKSNDDLNLIEGIFKNFIINKSQS